MARPLGWSTRNGHENMAFVNRYDWGYHFSDEADTPRTLDDIDSESGWKAARERQKRRQPFGKSIYEGHPDYERFERLDSYRSHSMFLIDAAHGPEAVKLLARWAVTYIPRLTTMQYAKSALLDLLRLILD